MAAIVWKVREAAEQRGITTPTQLAQQLDIAHNTALALWRGTPIQAHLPTLTKVCQVLRVGVADLLEFTEADTRGNHNAELMGLAA